MFKQEYYCLHCGKVFFLKSSADRCRIRAIPQMIEDFARKQAIYAASRKEKSVG